ncbi:MAG TPA: R3H domain-containing nucleic acid-binding protein [Roseiflexaceae bacterium]|nr:R3H domain-containing nucleic acid-binding protein [Roseiflexaceae bacterium]HMP38920.1 R3H domain-containing nucleic acid-binding protein [Roseiflexaceae bacterium]
MLDQHDITSNIDLLLPALPPHIRDALDAVPDRKEDLLEVIMDLGRLPEARYRDRELFLSDREITQEDIDYLVSRIGAFGEDNRAGIPRTLHRISAMRNRAGRVIGLTCRVGRAVFGTISILRDLVESGRSVLLLGKPGVGKTTLLRETARVLAEELRKRVVIVDTSNEIAGDGDIPHPGIGRARRMQVPRPSEQHAVMIEAVENHMPEVIVIDEIGTELEALAARTIAERGVQLIGTAHGQTLDNLLSNPTLSDLIGGIQAVTLGDEEARRRGTQKTVLERKAPPTFDILVEIQSWDEVTVYQEVATAVDALLRGEIAPQEARKRDEDGQIAIVSGGWAPPEAGIEGIPRRSGQRERGSNGSHRNATPPRNTTAAAQPAGSGMTPQRIYPFGVSRDRLERAIGNLHVPATIVRDMQEATMVMTLKNYYRQGAQRVRQAEDRGVPVYVLRNNTTMQMERQLIDVFQLAEENLERDVVRRRSDDEDLLADAMLETETAINQILNGERRTVELMPRSGYVRRLQHQMAERYNIQSESRGREPHRRVKISR